MLRIAWALVFLLSAGRQATVPAACPWEMRMPRGIAGLFLTLLILAPAAAQGRGQPLLLEGHGKSVIQVAFIGDDRLVSLDMDGEVRLWDTKTGASLWAFGKGVFPTISAIGVDPTGREIAVAGYGPGIRILDAATGAVLRRIQDPALEDDLARHKGNTLLYADGAVVVAMTDRQTRKIYALDPLTGRRIAVMEGPKAVDRLLLSPDRRRLATFGATDIETGNQDGIVRVWDRPGTLRWAFDTKTLDPGDIGFSADGTRLIVTCDAGVIVLDADTGKELRRFPLRDMVASRGVAPGGERVFAIDAVEGKYKVIFWDVATGEIAREMPVEDFFWYAAAFSPDGKRIAAATEMGNAIRIIPLE